MSSTNTPQVSEVQDFNPISSPIPLHPNTGDMLIISHSLHKRFSTLHRGLQHDDISAYIRKWFSPRLINKMVFQTIGLSEMFGRIEDALLAIDVEYAMWRQAAVQIREWYEEAVGMIREFEEAEGGELKKIEEQVQGFMKIANGEA